MSVLFDVIRFFFTEPIHISNPRSDYARSENVVRSDTISAAIMQSWAMMGKTEWIREQPGFITSSLFPYARLDNEYVYFFPKPVRDRPKNNLKTDILKKFNRVLYYEKELFEQRLHGPLEIIDDEIVGQYLTRKLEADNTSLYTSSVIPRIMKPRYPGADTRIFYMERRIFKETAGLFCLVKYHSEEMKKRFLTGLNLLAENGLGSDRAVGHGKFEFCEDTISLSLPAGSNYMINLSMYMPGSKTELTEALGKESQYDLIRRGGWIGEPYNTFRKRNVYMFSEGSVFKFNDTGNITKGRVVDVKPLTVDISHPVYRSGESIFLPINLK